MSENGEWVKLEHILKAPKEMIWDMWTQPELFAKWYGPNEMVVPTFAGAGRDRVVNSDGLTGPRGL